MRAFLIISFVITANILFAQFHQAVLTGLEGQTLLDELKQNYKPTSPLPSSQARDVMFGIIDNHNDSVTCVYTGYTIYLNPNDDPSQAAYMDGAGLNTEHTYPQGLGASGLAAGDLHHLFPTRTDVNGDRGSFPFGEISDNQTENWYYLNQETHQIPNQNIDRYSEWKNGTFEPREDHKGDVARAMMYFYTMYKPQADAEDPNFFNQQISTFCDWHVQDPVDQKEWDRTFQIANYQNGKPNPFVLDCSLAGRSFCTDVDIACLMVDIENIEEQGLFTLNQNAPNPFSTASSISYELEQSFEVTLRIFNSLGQEVIMVENERQGAGKYQVDFVGNLQLPKGLMFYQLTLKNQDKVYTSTKKMLRL
jgi:hypothetical protein